MVGGQSFEDAGHVAAQIRIKRAAGSGICMFDEGLAPSSLGVANCFSGRDASNPRAKRSRIPQPAEIAHYLDQRFLCCVRTRIECNRTAESTDPGRKRIEQFAECDQVSALGGPNLVEYFHRGKGRRPS